MRIGKLRHQVEIQEFTIIEDEIGVQIEEWVTVATVWASVEPLKGREYWAAAMVQAETTVKVTIRYLPGITPDHRLKFKGRIYDIQSIINPEERNRELELMCIARIYDIQSIINPEERKSNHVELELIRIAKDE